MRAKTDDRTFAVALAVLIAVVSAGSAPWWWNRVADGIEAVTGDEVFGNDDDFVGGCALFSLYAQNQFDPLGTKIWEGPSPTAESFRGFSPNELFTVDGWVRTRSPYTSNTSPWDSDAWFHLANGAGWVTFAGVRADPTDPDDGNFGAGSSPAPLDPDCVGSYRR